MTKITNINEHRKDGGKWVSGRCKCIVCQYEWVAIFPEGETFQECPNCHLFFGVSAPFMPDTRWVCNCGNDLFAVAPDGYYCVRCTVKQEGF